MDTNRAKVTEYPAKSKRGITNSPGVDVNTLRKRIETMKKALLLILAVMMALLAGCKGDGAKQNESTVSLTSSFLSTGESEDQEDLTDITTSVEAEGEESSEQEDVEALRNPPQSSSESTQAMPKPVTSTKKPSSKPSQKNPPSNIPWEMLNNPYLDALAYTGYKVQQQIDDGKIFKGFGSPFADKYFSGIGYNGNCSGLEKTSAGKPDIAKFKSRGGLVCASYVTYVYFNYLPNVAGVDISRVARPTYTRTVEPWVVAGNKWVEAGLSRKIPFTIDPDGDNFKPSEEIPIGSIIIFKMVSDKSYSHIALYAGYYNNQYILNHVGTSRGPEFTTVENMFLTKKPQMVYQIITPPFTIKRYGSIKVNVKDQSGKALSGATFTATNKSTKEQYKIGPTNSNGYAESTQKILFGDYHVVQTVFPNNYRSSGVSEWDITVGKDNAGVGTVNAVNEEIPGSCKIINTSEDGKVEGIEFTIAGNGVSRTVVTNAGGEAQVDDLKPGVYTIIEGSYDKYIPQEQHSVSIVSGQTATVTFNNTLRRGNLTVTVIAEDGLVEGRQFRLRGTSHSGLAVDEIRTVGQDGKAYFNDILIGSGYTLEAADTPDRYDATDSQTVDINWNKTTNAEFQNTLKKVDESATNPA